MLLVDLSKVSGPLLDRIDIYVKVSALEIKDLKGGDTGETSVVLRDRVNEAREVQQRRLNGVASGTGTSTCTNAQMSGKQVKLYCQLDADADALLHQAMMELGLSARGFNKILKIARTIADLEGTRAVRK